MKTEAYKTALKKAKEDWKRFDVSDPTMKSNCRNQRNSRFKKAVRDFELEWGTSVQKEFLRSEEAREEDKDDGDGDATESEVGKHDLRKER